MRETTAARVSFKVVCDACGSLQIKVADPIKAGAENLIRCGRCEAVRGTLDQLHSLARASTDVFEI